jgi:UDP-glucuronate 4-epimerase
VALGRVADKRLVDIQPGDVPATYADIDALTDAVGFKPSTPIEVGVKRFVDWYRSFYLLPPVEVHEIGGRAG